ncbi:S1 family peptidase [Catenuloplanes japonicus]|uniref:S1 family peptidase n=1 Tax=Catenuloplanes japonicus TaxID=33876 RepID=UPI000524608E|nr:S1 family peptidase [Catenuloplanes japonicus]
MRLVAIAALLLTLVTAPAPAFAGPAAGPDPETLPGTAWWTDPATGTRTVSADDTVAPRDLARLSRTGATVVREPGTRTKRLAGGDSIYPTGGYRCTIGFNARSTSAPKEYYFITSGHCVGPVGSTVRIIANGTIIGTVVQRLEPRDFALVRYVSTVTVPHPSAVNRYDGTLQPITTFGTATVGQQVQRAGSTTGLWNGTVTAVNVTVNYADGTRISGLIRTNLCSEPGDSGGPLFSTTIGLGLASGGSGNCTSGGVTYFTPVTPLAAAWSVGPF